MDKFAESFLAAQQRGFERRYPETWGKTKILDPSEMPEWADRAFSKEDGVEGTVVFKGVRILEDSAMIYYIQHGESGPQAYTRIVQKE